jgi:cytochrome c biogenesis protein CcdA
MAEDINNSNLDNEAPDADDTRTSGTGIPQVMRNVFGVFMILIYIGMGILVFINFFGWTPSWYWLRWVGGSLFVLYGIWRGIRQFKGIDSSL